jgi:hypothetical protein
MADEVYELMQKIAERGKTHPAFKYFEFDFPGNLFIIDQQDRYYIIGREEDWRIDCYKNAKHSYKGFQPARSDNLTVSDPYDPAAVLDAIVNFLPTWNGLYEDPRFDPDEMPDDTEDDEINEELRIVLDDADENGNQKVQYWLQNNETGTNTLLDHRQAHDKMREGMFFTIALAHPTDPQINYESEPTTVFQV